MSDKAIQAFCDRKFGMFIHWGLYALPGGRHNGKTMEHIGEWFQSYFRMPNEEYAKFASKFNPVNFNADEWIRKAADAGIKYIVFTTKHHDGFCMYDTKVSDYNIVKMTPFGRDPLRELAEACRKYNVKLGVYYSHNLDWHEPDGGDPGTELGLNCGSMSWGNDWDFPDRSKKDFSRYFYGKVIPQVTELLTNYGEICELWCDCPMNIKPEFSRALRDLVKKLQPDCMINARIGNGCNDFQGLGDNQLLHSKSRLPVESPGTLNNTWGFKYDDHNWKPASRIIEQLVSLTEKNANYLLNVGPTALGEFTPETDRIFAAIAEWMHGKEDAIFASRPTSFPQELDFAYCTRKGNKLNFFLRKTPSEIKLDGIRSRVVRADVEFRQDGETVLLKLPDLSGRTLPLISLEFDEEPQIRQELMPQNGTLLLSATTAKIVEGKETRTSAGIEVDEAAIVHEVTNHAKIDRDGTLCDWNNPSDTLEWELFFPEGGDYALSVTTQTRWKNQPWNGDRSLILNWNGETVGVKELLPETNFPSPYFTKIQSPVGVLHIPAGGRGKLILQSPEIRSEDAGKINLNSIQISRI